MKKLSLIIIAMLAILASCKKAPEINIKYVDIEREVLTIGSTTANIQCDYQYIATLKSARVYYGVTENGMSSKEMQVISSSLYAEITGLECGTTYMYYYEFDNGYNMMQSGTKSFVTETSATVVLPTVITADVTEITATSAVSGGNVTNDGGGTVTERGICWSTSANPTISNSHVAAGTGIGEFAASMTGLEANTTYHVRAYAINEKGTAYGLDKEFTTLSNGGGGDHEYVDLGLPSGTLWATCNIGANAPEEYGDYFAWGETQPKDYFIWSNCQYSMDNTGRSLTKYCNNPDYGYNGFTDNLTTLLQEDDAASANWGSSWRMPTQNEWRELLDNTDHTWTTQNGVYGLLFTASNGNNLFLPASGTRWESEFLNNVGEFASYWSSSLYADRTNAARVLEFALNGLCCMSVGGRAAGLSVRAVRNVAPPTPPTPPGEAPDGAINGLFTINENGDQVYFSKGNLQYQASTNTWRFAENQYDIVGEDNVNISSTYNGWIDLFGWGTSGYNHGAVCYQPWSTSQDNDDYLAYGMWQASLNDQTGQADWGYNSISNGGNQNNIWRTLTIDEWKHVFFTRQVNYRFAVAKINNIKGVLLLPDDWNTSVYQLNNYNESTAFTTNVLSGSDLNTLEMYGVVFLPVAGWRGGYGVGAIDSWGQYWSATFISGTSPHYMHFSSGNVSNQCSNFRYIGYSVRLVHSANY